MLNMHIKHGEYAWLILDNAVLLMMGDDDNATETKFLQFN